MNACQKNKCNSIDINWLRMVELVVNATPSVGRGVGYELLLGVHQSIQYTFI